jgi:hypothetical protein
LIQLPEDQNSLIYQDQALGLHFAVFRSCRDNDPYTGFAKFMEHDWFPEYFNTLPFEEKEMIARYIGWCVDKEQYDLEKVLTLIVNNQQETKRIMHSVAQQYVNQGISQGILQGISQGITQGRLQGISQGRAQGITQRTWQIAQSMLRDNASIDQISKWTGLDRKTIAKLQQTSF